MAYSEGASTFVPKSGDHFTETYVGEEMGGLDFALSTAATAVQLMPRTREVRQLARSELMSQRLPLPLTPNTVKSTFPHLLGRRSH